MNKEFQNLLKDVLSTPEGAKLLEEGRKWVTDNFTHKMTLVDFVKKYKPRLSHSYTDYADYSIKLYFRPIDGLMDSADIVFMYKNGWDLEVIDGVFYFKHK